MVVKATFVVNQDRMVFRIQVVQYSLNKFMDTLCRHTYQGLVCFTKLEKQLDNVLCGCDVV